MKKNILVVMAMKEESGNLFEDNNVKPLYTGLGKINATYNLTRAIEKEKPDMVLNLGSAGSSKYKVGQVIECVKFFQRDMDCTPLGFEKYETPFDDVNILTVEGILTDHEKGVLGTGDSFDTDHGEHPYDVVDMEGYGLAKVCKLYDVKFASFKYITDGADDSSADDWNENLNSAAKLLFDVYSKVLRLS